ncbi:hypothetical protein ACQP25_16485 [Microtetraspora malaysiensis]|uniref:hypothetical protein n=1 Tax=Microtetraspora malaysiensis TaxID=161358 RepID=UPI003D90B749
MAATLVLTAKVLAVMAGQVMVRASVMMAGMFVAIARALPPTTETLMQAALAVRARMLLVMIAG